MAEMRSASGLCHHALQTSTGCCTQQRQVDKLVLKFLSGTRVDPRPHEQFVRLDLLAGQRRRPELAFGIA
jgi:hypothetical protein